MATRGVDNFGNDGARDYLKMLTTQLVATISFTGLKKVPYEERSQYKALFDPLGWFNPASVDFGAYTPSTKTLSLPYNVPGYSSTSNYGEFTGTLEGRRFSGIWSAKPLGEVGSFDVMKVGR